LFVVGLNEGKFFGQDSAEEGLKLLERIAEHGPTYQLLFSLSERELNQIEAENKVANNRLTPSRDLEGDRNSEFIPIVQAGMVDKRPRRHLGRILRTTQSHVAWLLWKHPREAVKLYWAYRRRKDYKDAACQRFWSEHFPISASAYFDERAELVAIRAVEQLAVVHAQGRSGAEPATSVLVVGNDIFRLVCTHLSPMLDEEAHVKLGDAAFSRNLRDRASELCLDVPDLTPLLVFVYLGLPLLAIQFTYLGLVRATRSIPVRDTIFEPDTR